MYPSKALAFATQDLVAREQWLSGICSQSCWDAGVPEEEEAI
jgi:hypothetical protein